jgi:transposase-like protein
MTRRFSIALKQQMVALLSCANAPSAAQLARETGIRQQNLSRWLNEARSIPHKASNNGSDSAWTVGQRALRQPRFWCFEKRSKAKLKERSMVSTNRLKKGSFVLPRDVGAPQATTRTQPSRPARVEFDRRVSEAH